MANKKQKSYNRSDRSFRFVDAEDVLDFCYEGFPGPKALMSCGHAVTPMSLTHYCRYLLNKGDSEFVCGQGKCTAKWSYVEVRKMALLTPEEAEEFERALTANAVMVKIDTKTCPGCRFSVARKALSNLSVRCSVCSARTGRTYEFCWQCLKEWKGHRPRSDRCDNDGCANEALKTLKSCPTMTFEAVSGVSGCPSIRACPSCGTLVEHSTKKCKNITCPQCKVEFCFVCLKITAECLKTSSHFKPCPVAPRQTAIPYKN